MPKVLITDEADNDLIEIWMYVAERNLDAAERLLSTIHKKCLLIASSPEIGRQRNELAKNLRSLPQGKYVIFYRSIEDGIEVIRILHGAQDIESIFAGE